MKNKKKQTGITADVWYNVSGYGDGTKNRAMRVFYCLTDSFAEAYNQIIEDFETYRLLETRDPKSGYYSLNYEIGAVSLEKRILD